MRAGPRIFLLRLLAVAVAAGLAGAVLITAGLVPVAASSGHWGVTAWVLHFTMRQSVGTQSWGITPPDDLDDPARVLRGAGHYGSGCAPCHGAPGEMPPVLTRHMTPDPPWLPPKIPEWRDRELFWIVRHGIRFSAMPAWPAFDRRDEVWDMVAFIRRLPDMSPAEYIRLSRGEGGGDGTADTATRLRGLDAPDDTGRMGPVLTESCARCHGVDGLGRGAGAFPRLAGQSAEYLAASLTAYAAGRRHSGVMQPVAASLDAETITALARHYAGLPAAGPTGPSEASGPAEPAEPAELRALGRRIVTEGLPGKGVPACRHCHGPGNTARRSPLYPVLAGQYPGYLENQLRLFAEGTRGGTPFSHIMRSIAERLDARERRAAALWFAALPPGEARPEADREPDRAAAQRPPDAP